jgi:hypothetical protein
MHSRIEHAFTALHACTGEKGAKMGSNVMVSAAWLNGNNVPAWFNGNVISASFDGAAVVRFQIYSS